MENINFIKGSLAIVEYNVNFAALHENILQNLNTYLDEKKLQQKVKAIKSLTQKDIFGYQHDFERWLKVSVILYKKKTTNEKEIRFCGEILESSYLQHLFFIKFFSIAENKEMLKKEKATIEKVVRFALSLPPQRTGLSGFFIEKFEQRFWGSGSSYHRKIVEGAYLKIEDVGFHGHKMFVFAENTPPSVVADFSPTDEQIKDLNPNARLVYNYLPKIIKYVPRLLQNRWQLTLAIDELMTKEIPANWRNLLDVEVRNRLHKITYSSYEAEDLFNFIRNNTNY